LPEVPLTRAELEAEAGEVAQTSVSPSELLQEQKDLASDRLFAVVEGHFAKGKRVFIDSDPRWWLPCGWQREEIPKIAELEQHFRFRRVTDVIFELRPLTDSTAEDKPDLKRLLPENRPEDAKKCPGNPSGTPYRRRFGPIPQRHRWGRLLDRPARHHP
jgi:thiol-disulfide isomerase/thioredoxin